MNEIELYTKDGKSVGVFACAQCRHVHQSREFAARCCKNYLCSTCGQDTGSRHWLICEKCRTAEEVKKEAERFEKAEKVTEWDGYLYHGDDFYADLGSLLDDLEWHDGEQPKYAWTCDPVSFVHFDIDRVIDDIMEREDVYEDFDSSDIRGTEELKAALEKFNEANAGIVSYHPNYKRAFLIPEEEAE